MKNMMGDDATYLTSIATKTSSISYIRMIFTETLNIKYTTYIQYYKMKYCQKLPLFCVE